MIKTESIGIYDVACKYRKTLSQNRSVHNYGRRYGNDYSRQYGCAYSSNYRYENRDQIVLEKYYLHIINTAIYELVVKRNCSLLSYLCALNNIQVDVVNFDIEYTKQVSCYNAYDLLPVVSGLNNALSKDLKECLRRYKNEYEENMFQGKDFSSKYDYASQIKKMLKFLDENIGEVLSRNKEVQGSENSEELKMDTGVETIDKVYDPKLAEWLNQFAENRQAGDAKLSEEVKRVQLVVQDELNQIMLLREDIEFNILQEPINQLISLFSLFSDSIEYHSNNERTDSSYTNLIESGVDFLENILQSLAMMGVTIINDAQKPFNPARHKSISATQPTRSSTVTKVVKIGFEYKGKVFEKAKVEII
ncbi:nucleotide exchange factor GrpE [Enterococcus sp. 669A]|uniref:Nucleotide exchange factor GrpE n=1 Tax=Candidatus Enterococcus moelleringii TaxID=2815325 RepID=A0ABS3L9K1_9ENTE|nr:nucleotide exchange factor GrpE [Enterococcus sp. 669A]MBO1306308.1 nucleotide exchange factor GrpE [Enterococcus sp. 669A]